MSHGVLTGRPSAHADRLPAGASADVQRRLAEIEFAAEAMLYRCECGLVACATAIKLTGLDYMGLRANPRRFAVFAEHAIPEAEEVVATRGGWAVVEKLPGPAADFAAAT